MLRRLASLLMVLLTLNVSAAEALRACEKEATHQAAPAHESCEKNAPTPAKSPAACCDAMASCTTTLTIDGATDESRVIPDRGVIAPRAAIAPSALDRSPEPPPPRGQA